MSTAKEIEDAIRALEQTERDKLLQHLPQLFPEVPGDVEWERIIRDADSSNSIHTFLQEFVIKAAHDAPSEPMRKCQEEHQPKSQILP